MTAGRPTKLTPELVALASTYLEQCRDAIKFTDKDAISYVEVELPSAVGMARFLGIHKDTLYAWCKGEDDLSKEISDYLREVEDEQEKRLISSGLGGLYNTKIASMLLSRKGYAEKTETDVTTKGESLNENGDEIKARAKAFDEWYKTQLRQG